MKTTIEVEINDNLIKNCANQILHQIFQIPSFYDSKVPTGYNILLKQVEEHIKTIDFSDMIRLETDRLVDGIVRDVTEQTLKKKIKAAMKEIESEGLFKQAPDTAKARPRIVCDTQSDTASTPYSQSSEHSQTLREPSMVDF